MLRHPWHPHIEEKIHWCQMAARVASSKQHFAVTICVIMELAHLLLYCSVLLAGLERCHGKEYTPVVMWHGMGKLLAISSFPPRQKYQFSLNV